jgi:hypothetical protein
VAAFSNRRVAVGACVLRFVRLLGVLLLRIGPRCRLCREQGEGGEEASTHPENFSLHIDNLLLPDGLEPPSPRIAGTTGGCSRRREFG